MNKTISIAVGDRIKIDGVGEVELVVVSPEPKQTATHPLVGKWVKCVKSESLERFKPNKWYKCVKDPKKLCSFIDESGIEDGWVGKNHIHFDLSQPCDFDPNMPEAINPKYKVGDEVVVLSPEHTYKMYWNPFWFFGFKNKDTNDSFEINKKATVFGVCYCSQNENLYALRDAEGNECVIGEEGIKLAPQIDKQEWLNAASRLFDSWMKIGGGCVPKKNGGCFAVEYNKNLNAFRSFEWHSINNSAFNFTTRKESQQFIAENEADLKTFFHVK